ncbi:MAG TPA: ATP synthase F1 subunit delta [Gemmataceae bacterium]|nr:ATP synthase F1 subunit delta [Gemmataceae bacterium]
MNSRDAHLPDARADRAPLHPTVLDVGTQRVAKVYAEAILRAAQASNQGDEILEEFESLVKDVLPADPRWEAFLSSGVIGQHAKAQALRSVFSSRASPLFVQALLVLNDHGRLNLLRPIVAACRELRDQQAGRMRVQVRSAIPLPDDQHAQLLQQLRQTFHKEPLLEVQVDHDLLGGMVVQVGDWLYDHSVRTQLESLRDQIIARSSYEIQSGRDRFCTTDGN